MARRAVTGMAPALRSSLTTLYSPAVPAEARGLIAGLVRQMATAPGTGGGVGTAAALARSPLYRALSSTPLAARLGVTGASLRPPPLPSLLSSGGSRREMSMFMRMANYVTRGVDADALRRFERAANAQTANVAAQMLYLQALQK
jgi:hypothetical protein